MKLSRNNTETFKTQFSLEKRKQEASKILEKYPDRIPCIVQKSNNDKSDITIMDKKKFLLPSGLTFSQLIHVVRCRIKISSHQAIFVLVNGQMINGTRLMSEVYNEHKDIDGFLYTIYSTESTFGN